MKKIVFVFIIGLICLDQLEARKVEGYFITKSLDTVKVIFTIPVDLFTQEINFEKLQWRVKYVDSVNQKQVLKPANAKEILFYFDGEAIRMLSCQNNLQLWGSIFSDNNDLFLQLVIDGKLRLFKYYQRNYNSGMYNASTGMMTGGYSYTIEKYIMQKKNEGLFKTSWLSFKKDMVNYLSDCSDLAKKINEKIYRSDDIEEIVGEYNKSCSK